MKRILLLAMTLAVVVLPLRSAWANNGSHAVQFNTTCKWDGTYNYVPVNIDTINTMLTQKNYNPRINGEIGNNLNYDFILNANKATRKATLFFSNFSLEQNMDKVTISDVQQVDANGNPYNAPLEMTGWLQGVAVGVSHWTNFMQQEPTYIFLQTDQQNAVSSLGFTINQVALYSDCWQITDGTPPTPQRLFTDGRVHVGVLGGPGDTIYYSISAEGAAAQNRHNAVIQLFREPDTDGVDFDLYAKCNALPTATSFDVWSNYSGQYYSSTEFLYLPESKCPNGTWYIAVNAYSGVGSYYLLSNYLMDRRPSLELNNTITDTTTNSTVFTATYLALREYFGMNEMSQSFGTVDNYFFPSATSNQLSSVHMNGIFSNCSTSNVWWNDINNRVSQTGWITLCMPGVSIRPVSGAHELSHWEWTLADEYQEITGSNPRQTEPKCGHSVMADSSNPWSHDYCIGQYTVQYAPTVHDHLVDYHYPPVTPQLNVPSAWSTVNAQGNPYRPSFTPIGYTFANAPLTYSMADGMHSFITQVRHATTEYPR